MNSSDGITPIASRRRMPAERAKGAAVERDGNRLALAVLGVVVAVIVSILVAAAHVNPAIDLSRLPVAVRQGYVARSLQDLTEGCARPDALPGFVRQHCEAQARFVLEFPECDSQCRSVAAKLVATRPTK
jgi:hypothetical protein